MGVRASAIINAANDDVGIKATGEPLSAADAQDSLARLNKLVSSLRIQPGTVMAIERMAFPLVANQQTYTIGVGGDFNVPRPVNPAAITGAGLWLQALAAAQAVTSITRSGFVATVTQTAHGLSVGDETLIDGADQLLYNGLQTVQTVPTANTFTYTVQGTPVTPATGTLTSAAVSGQPVEIPRTVITDDGFQSIQIKNLPNAQFTNVYYNPTFPLGQIFLWPKPNTAINQLVLYLQGTFTGFATLFAEYEWPDMPGYELMLEYNLAELLIPFGQPGNADFVRTKAKETLGLIKRANTRLVDLPTDASLLTWNRRGGYNINTGTGGY
jgi:hypothetical protein